MKKIRKGKKILLILLAIIVAVIAIVLIVKVVDKIQHGKTEVPEVQAVVPLPETTYSNMQVKNIMMEYMKDNDQTKVSMEIHNTTQNQVENEHLTAMLINAEETVIGQMPTWIQSLGAGEQYKIEVILSGDLTATTHIKLIEK